jgi:hypothetical protein
VEQWFNNLVVSALLHFLLESKRLRNIRSAVSTADVMRRSLLEDKQTFWSVMPFRSEFLELEMMNVT